MSANYACKYSDKVDERFSLASITAPAVNGEFDWTGAQTVNVYSIPTVSMTDYSMSGVSRYGTPSELGQSTQTMTLSRDRSFSFIIDRRSYEDNMMVKEAGRALSRQLDEVVIPEIDIYRLSVLSDSAGSKVYSDITSSNAYSAFLDGMNALTEGKVPQRGRVAFITPHFYKSIRLDGAFIKSGDMAQDMLVRGAVGMIEGVSLILAPTGYFKDKTEFIITHPSALVSPVKLSEYKIHDNPPGINGWLIEGRFYYDAFVLNNKKADIYLHCAAAAAPSDQGGQSSQGGQSGQNG